MFYSTISIKGFGPHYKKKTFNFDSGVNTITGINGSGKTTIFDAIQWCLYGPRGSDRTLKERDSIINDRSQSAHVELVLFSEIGSKLKINRSLTRSKKHSLSLEVDDVKIDRGLTELQEEIEYYCGGINSDVFSSASMMISSPTHSVNKFISGTPLDRRKVLSIIVDPDNTWINYNKILKKKVTELKKNIQSVKNDEEINQRLLNSMTPVSKIDTSIEDIQIQLESLYEKKEEVESNDEIGRNKLLRIKFDRLNEELKELIDSIEENSNKKINIVTEIAEIKSDIRKAENNKSEFSNVKLQLKSHLESLEHHNLFLDNQNDYLLGEKTLLLADLTREKTLNELFHQSGNKCVVCGSELDHDHVINDVHDHDKNIENISKEISALDETILMNKKKKNLNDSFYKEIFSQYESSVDWDSEIEILNKRLETLYKEDNNFDNNIVKMKERKKEIQLEIKDIQDKLDQLDNNEEIVDSQSIFNEINFLEKELLRIESNHNEYEHYIAKTNELNDNIDKSEKELIWRNSVLDNVNSILVGTSPTGYISEDIEEFCNLVNDKVNDVYIEVFNKDADISIVSSSDNDEPTCIIFSHGRNIETYSHGEQARMIMSILCALTQSIQEKTGVWLPPLWDEPTLAIDKKDGMSVIDILEDMSEVNNEQCLIITRDNDIIDSNSIKV